MSDETRGHEALKASSLRRWRVEFASSEGYGTQYVWAPAIEHVRTWARDYSRKEDEENPDAQVTEVVETSRNEFTLGDHVLLGDGMYDSPLEKEVTTITRTAFETLLNRLYTAGRFASKDEFWIPFSFPELALSPEIIQWLDGWGPRES